MDEMVFYNLIVGGTVVESKIPYPTVLDRTGLRDQVGLTELGWEEYFEPEPEIVITPEQVLQGVRSIRNHLLGDSDWTQFADSPLSADVKAEWAVYRQALRDLPATSSDLTDPRDVILPIIPE
jgi:hypothetical protein